MASIYRKTPESDVIWLRYRSPDGRWKGKATSYKWSNIGEVRQAKLLARRQSEIEAEQRTTSSQRLDEWVLPWILDKYGGMETTTPDRYKRIWRTLSEFLESQKIYTANQITREDAGRYLKWRTKEGPRNASKNSAIQELKILAMIVDEAKERNHCLTNPMRKLGLKKTPAKEKEIWSHENMKTGAEFLQKHGTLWQRASFFLGLYQACRIRQCELPLRGIRLDLNVIQYPDALVKGRQGYTQPIDPRFLPILKSLMEEAKAEGLNVLCKIPWDSGLRFRRTFDRAGLEGLSHHGLRTTWITRAAENGVPESQAMAFCHHESREVHRIYKKLSAIGIAHVPSLMSLPSFDIRVDSGGDSSSAKPDSVSES